MSVKVFRKERYKGNSTYGITIDKFNPMYDPKRGREVPLAGQVLMTDLLDKLEDSLGDKCVPIQYNTDGIIMKLVDEEAYKTYIDVCEKWCKRVRLSLEHDRIKKIYQKDVNNYIFVFENGKLECKGAYLQVNTKLKNDMSILNEALREYIINGVRVEDTINNCNELIKFQHINKIGKTYFEVLYGEQPLNERVIRTFASTRETDPQLFKVKLTTNKEGDTVKSIQKVSLNSNHVFINNNDITNEKCPDYLDKDWYIEEAIKRLKSFGIKYE